MMKFTDPLVCLKFFWPQYDFYDKQREIIYSIRDNVETIVPAANKMGKDFVAGAIGVGAFLFPNCFLGYKGGNEVRVIATSVKDDHLRVLFGEMGRFIATSKYPLRVEDGGPLIVNHRELRKLGEDGQLDPISYFRGMTSADPEGFAGHHALHTLGIGDECSALDPLVFTQMRTWAKRRFYFGNPRPCAPTHPFQAGVKGGNVAA